jgi:predicted acyl esterase
MFRNLPAGDGYSVTAPTMAVSNTTSPVRVMTIDNSLPPQDFYANQDLKPGFNYITTRDGTKLAAFITLPGPASEGPYPTVVNYSGYNPAQPGAPIPGNYSFLCGSLPVFCDAPNDPSAEVAAIMGYATVGVNMRGTGCSGGAYDYFETMQLLDGYDVIETVAAQSWVAHNKVGMTGLSYPGITQLFVATTHPPSLAAITPLSVIGNTYTTGRPGGIFNDGFALTWITQVLDRAAPYGQGWEAGLVAAGDTVCEENQLLHSQRVDVIQEAKNTPYYDAFAASVNPTVLVNQIDVPVYLSGQWQDEQTGPFFFTLLDKFTGSPLTRFTMVNGVHPDGFAPQNLVEWKSFLDIYVAQQVPSISADVLQLGPQLFQAFFQVPVALPPSRFSKYATWQDAKAAYEAEQPYRVIFEDGADAPLGGPVGTYDTRFASWPHPALQPMRFYFQPDGSLGSSAPADDSEVGSSFLLDPAAGHRGILAPNGNVWDPLPNYAWRPLPVGYDVVFDSAPLTEDLVMIGSASADLWIRSPVDDADLEVNIIEARPDGQERFVQTGWLRASLRALAPDATDLWPDHTFEQADEAPLVPGQWTLARVGVPAFGHVFRKGSRVRVTVDTPGDSRASWTFALKTYPGAVAYDVGHAASYASSILLPVIQGMASQTPLPACPSLRAQQCRPYEAYTNTPSMP